MGGKGELVGYTREYKKAPLSPAEKKELLDIVEGFIDEATTAITVIVLVENSKDE